MFPSHAHLPVALITACGTGSLMHSLQPLPSCSSAAGLSCLSQVVFYLSDAAGDLKTLLLHLPGIHYK